MTGRRRALPDRRQLELLRAATGDGEAALAAWRRWNDAVVLDQVDGESYGLLPLAYRNLKRQGAALDGRLGGIYKRTWLKNRLGLRRAAVAVAALSARGIRALVLKGAAMALLHYRDAGARVMEDIDLLVPTERLDDGVAALDSAGFRPGNARGQAPPFDADWRALHHSYPFHDDAGNELDLHWYLSSEARRPGDDEGFWQAAVPLDLDGTPALALAPTDQLYHVCAHAYASNSPHVRWLADAMTLLRVAEIDWPRLVAHARARRVVPALAETLGLLATELGAPVPQPVLDELARTPLRLVDRLEHAHNVSARPYSLTAVMVRLWCWNRRGVAPDRSALAELPRFLHRYYGVEGRRELAMVVMKRAAARLRREGF